MVQILVVWKALVVGPVIEYMHEVGHGSVVRAGSSSLADTAL
jgi:hypothetical protein